MIEYQYMVLGALLVMTLVAAVNMFSFQTVERHGRPATFPLVSVLVPARNEELNLRSCLGSLVQQEYQNLEILVLDDSSDDETLRIAEEYAGMDPRVRVLHGQPLPMGWTGKGYACHQLARASSGELLLFVDADTIHKPQSVGAAVATMERTRVDLLTLIPYQIMGTFWEKSILPLLHFSTFCFLPFPLVRLSRNPKFAMANGQFMMFRRRAYEETGGHEAVPTAIVEDVWLARLVKRCGFTVGVMDGGETVSCRMYTSLPQIWGGFSKNLFAGMRYSIAMIAAVSLFNIVTSILPFGLLVYVMMNGGIGELWFEIVLLQVGILLGLRFMLALRFKMSPLFSLMHPLAMGMLVGIAVNSCRWVLAAGGSRWKGRKYDFRNQAVAQE